MVLNILHLMNCRFYNNWDVRVWEQIPANSNKSRQKLPQAKLNSHKTFLIQSVTWLKEIYWFTMLLLPLSISPTLNESKSSLGCIARFYIIAKNVGWGIKICPCFLNNNFYICVCSYELQEKILTVIRVVLRNQPNI